MKEQEQAVRRYFDHIAGNYSGRYEPSNVYYHYFFNERLSAATRSFDFEKKVILDVGAGAGALYNFLKKSCHSFEYYGTDISEKMLERSQIPKTQRRLGSLPDISFPPLYFDYIFMLGVTTYMSVGEFEKHLLLIRNYLKPGGKVVISFTHRCSFDFQIRRLFRFNFFKNIGIRFIKSSGENRVIAQGFNITGYCRKDIRRLEMEGLNIQRVEWLNQTVSPINQLMPSVSVGVARRIKKYFPVLLLRLFSSDLLVVFYNKPSKV